MYVDLNLTDGTCRHPPQEYADFMRQVESESAAVATQQAAEDEDQAAERRERDAFEQLYVCLLYGDAIEHCLGWGRRMLSSQGMKVPTPQPHCSVRLQRLEALKEAARQRAGRLQKDEALEAATAAIYDASAPVSLGEALSRSEKRRKVRIMLGLVSDAHASGKGESYICCIKHRSASMA